MAILIKDVDITKCCNECRLKYAVKCRTYTGFHHQDTERAAKCPLVEVWDDCQKCTEALPSARPERKKMSTKEWVDFLSEQFTVSRTSAREMLHGLMKLKAEDNFKKQFSGRK